MSQPPSTMHIIENLFTKKALNKISIPILQPADPFLDMAGEALRRRIFMTENENGDSLCLRPEFTIPVCLEHIKNAATTPQQYAYIGEVFRQHRNGNNGFYQAGIEDLGEEDEAKADARSLSNALDILTLIAPQKINTITLGDQGIFASVLSQLGLESVWQKKLLRSFGNKQQLLQIMADLSKPNTIQNPFCPLDPFIQKQDEQALTAALEKEMLLAGISPSSGRTPNEIAKRLCEKHKISSAQLSPKALKAVQEFLEIKVPLHLAEKTLVQFGQKYHLNIEHFLQAFIARNHALLKAGLKLEEIFYDAAFGRPLDYYTGLVYEIRHGDNVIVGGGRYNYLMTMLGAKKPISAVGFSIWLDRISDYNCLDEQIKKVRKKQ